MDTVADIIGDQPQAETVRHIPPPIVEGCPAFPEPGIYFGMPEDTYHAIVCVSASGMKDLSASLGDYWGNSRMNPDREDNETEFKAKGRAFHCRICEGEEAFKERYYIELDQADYPQWTEDYDFDPSCLELPLCVTVKHLRKAIEMLGGKAKGTEKGPIIEQLREMEPEWPVWDVLEAEQAAKHPGKLPISAKLHRRIEIATRMITVHPDLKTAFTDGHAEVSLFWYCPRTGVPMKCRIDYLKLNAFIDLKTFGNPMGKPVQRAVDSAISNGKHYLPVVIYSEGIAEVKRLVREMGLSRVGVYDQAAWAKAGERRVASQEETERARKWAWQWAHQPEPEALYIYQRADGIPVTVPRLMTKGTTFTVNEFAAQWLKRKWRTAHETFGTEQWVDVIPIERTVDESLTWSATDFGET